MIRRLRSTTVVATAALLAAACATVDPTAVPAEQPETPAFTKLPPTTAISTCGPGSGATVVDDVLTIATDDPAYPPWFEDDDPSNGRGFEGATARTIAERLGYAPERIEYTRVQFDEALTAGPKSFDFDINQFTIIGERRDNVDLSSPYYAVAQAVVAMEGTPVADATDLSTLGTYRLGAQSGSTSLQAIAATIGAASSSEFATTDEAKSALADGDVDGIVVDLPTAFQIVSDGVPGSVLVGQFPQPNEVTAFFGVVLEKGGRMTACVNAAIDSMYADGTLDELSGTWLGDIDGARVLE